MKKIDKKKDIKNEEKEVGISTYKGEIYSTPHIEVLSSDEKKVLDDFQNTLDYINKQFGLKLEVTPETSKTGEGLFSVRDTSGNKEGWAKFKKWADDNM